MRKVQYKHWKTGETIVASFHQWAQDNDGDGNPCPVALVEHPDGRVDTVYAGYITFIDEPEGEQPADERKDAAIVTMSDALKGVDAVMQILYEGGFRAQMYHHGLPDRPEFEKLISLGQTWLKHADVIKQASRVIAGKESALAQQSGKEPT